MGYSDKRAFNYCGSVFKIGDKITDLRDNTTKYIVDVVSSVEVVLDDDFLSNFNTTNTMHIKHV